MGYVIYNKSKIKITANNLLVFFIRIKNNIGKS